MTASAPHPPQVVILRPKGQADPLMEAMRSAWTRTLGAPPPKDGILHLPTIEIEPVPCPDLEAVVRSIGSNMDPAPEQRPQWAVFTSPNAVDHAPDGLVAALERAGTRFAAPGAGTARALQRFGASDVLYPETYADSEGLLNSPALARVGGARVMIATGADGRGAIANGLRTRGARVFEHVVYRRIGARAEALTVQLEALRAPGDTALVTSSAEALEHLARLLGEHRRPWLHAVTLVCPGERIAHAARALGISRIMRTGSPYGQDLARAVAGWLELREAHDFAKENDHE